MTQATLQRPPGAPATERILGIPFHCGTAADAVRQTLAGRGLVVAPSGPNLAVIDRDPVYRSAVTGASLALTDSGLMLLLWALRTGRRLPRVSGLGYLRALLAHPGFAREQVLWVVPGPVEAQGIRQWLESRQLPPGAYYSAPFYSRSSVSDPALLARLARERPGLVILCISGGVQEKLGQWLLDHLDYRPGVVCIGAAIGFITGAQAAIPTWADRLCLGWLLRCLRDPRRFVGRYLAALRLIPVLLRWGSEEPAYK